MKPFSRFTAYLLLILFSGCNMNNALVGSWSGESQHINGNDRFNHTSDIDIFEDGTAQSTWGYPQFRITCRGDMLLLGRHPETDTHGYYDKTNTRGCTDGRVLMTYNPDADTVEVVWQGLEEDTTDTRGILHRVASKKSKSNYAMAIKNIQLFWSELIKNGFKSDFNL